MQALQNVCTVKFTLVFFSSACTTVSFCYAYALTAVCSGLHYEVCLARIALLVTMCLGIDRCTLRFALCSCCFKKCIVRLCFVAAQNTWCIVQTSCITSIQTHWWPCILSKQVEVVFIRCEPLAWCWLMKLVMQLQTLCIISFHLHIYLQLRLELG